MTLYNDSYLMHYGVLGMRWGVHRAKLHSKRAAAAKKRGDISRYRSETNRANQLTEKHQALARKAYSYTNKESLGKSFVKSMIFNTAGTLDYNEMRANNTPRTKAAAKTIVKHWAPGLLSSIVTRHDNGVGGQIAAGAGRGLGLYNQYLDRRNNAYARTGKVYI